MVKCSIGQDSHAFEKEPGKPLILGGVLFKDSSIGLRANSDGDVVLHAITNAISGITGRNILGKIADDICKSGITDSAAYLKVAIKDLSDTPYKINHLSITIECLTPKIAPYISDMKENIAYLLGISASDVGITATTGEGLTQFGQGLGISVFCILTVSDRTDGN
ncbi:MAG: 2-C-methyl-D-erythritol 2,4-cyclodiphosphate synthase [Clostridia bacterium]|nr:2-C-methyl-D-erythritol 2,4-cyclodiphosphate synthase [Clostridia bacterium]